MSYDRLIDFDAAIAARTGHHQALLATRDQLTRELDALGAEHDDIIDGTSLARSRRRSDLADALRQVTHGITPNEGVIAELVPLAGTPGLLRTAERIEQLRAERDALASRLAIDPNGLGRYRLVRGKYFEHTANGLRRVKVGDIVTLTNQQVASNPEAFEPVA